MTQDDCLVERFKKPNLLAGYFDKASLWNCKDLLDVGYFDKASLWNWRSHCNGGNRIYKRLKKGRDLEKLMVFLCEFGLGQGGMVYIEELVKSN